MTISHSNMWAKEKTMQDATTAVRHNHKYIRINGANKKKHKENVLLSDKVAIDIHTWNELTENI